MSDVSVTDTSIDKSPKSFNIPHAIKLRLKHQYSYQQIADVYNMSRQAVHQRLRRFTAILDRPDALESFEDVRKDILSAIEIKLLEKIVDSKTLKDASLNNAAYAYDKIALHNRLEQGKITVNIAASVMIQEEGNLREIARQMAMKAIKAMKEVEEDNTPEATIESKT